MKNLKTTLRYHVIFLLLLQVTSGCETFLDKKADDKVAVPIKPEHFQALLNEPSRINISVPEGEIGTDDFYHTDDFIESMCEGERNLYSWNHENPTPCRVGNEGWRHSYTLIYHCNVVLQGIQRQFGDDIIDSQFHNVKGQAHFHRASSLLEMAGVWCDAYNENLANTALGLPLRLSPDFNEPTTRSTLEKTYRQIISDIEEAINLLPERQQTKWWPSKSAAYALLARTYLLMRNHEQALVYADSCLALNSRLVDFKALEPSRNPVFDGMGSDEVIFPKQLLNWYTLYGRQVKVSPELLEQYANGDLRKVIFYGENPDGTFHYRGNFVGNFEYPFSGIATDEIYLIRAECLARAGDAKLAMATLNELLAARWDSSFVPIAAESAEQALQLILLERRKELVFRGLRWPDVKRLNIDGADISLKRTIGGQINVLPANDSRFTLQIYEDVVSYSGIEQNK